MCDPRQLSFATLWGRFPPPGAIVVRAVSRLAARNYAKVAHLFPRLAVAFVRLVLSNIYLLSEKDSMTCE